MVVLRRRGKKGGVRRWIDGLIGGREGREGGSGRRWLETWGLLCREVG
jgi:hypothetical protein